MATEWQIEATTQTHAIYGDGQRISSTAAKLQPPKAPTECRLELFWPVRVSGSLGSDVDTPTDLILLPAVTTFRLVLVMTFAARARAANGDLHVRDFGLVSESVSVPKHGALSATISARPALGIDPAAQHFRSLGGLKIDVLVTRSIGSRSLVENQYWLDVDGDGLICSHSDLQPAIRQGGGRLRGTRVQWDMSESDRDSATDELVFEPLTRHDEDAQTTKPGIRRQVSDASLSGDSDTEQELVEGTTDADLDAIEKAERRAARRRAHRQAGNGDLYEEYLKQKRKPGGVRGFEKWLERRRYDATGGASRIQWEGAVPPFSSSDGAAERRREPAQPLPPIPARRMFRKPNRRENPKVPVVDDGRVPGFVVPGLADGHDTFLENYVGKRRYDQSGYRAEAGGDGNAVTGMTYTEPAEEEPAGPRWFRRARQEARKLAAQRSRAAQSPGTRAQFDYGSGERSANTFGNSDTDFPPMFRKDDSDD